MKSSVSFDLDGVLFDSRRLVEQAYEAVGVQMPKHAWGKPYMEWLIDYCNGSERHAHALHKAKTIAYGRLVRNDCRGLTNAAVVASDMQFHVITGASWHAANTVLEHIGLWHCVIGIYTGQEFSEKIYHASRHIHVDDDRGVVAALTEAVHYTGQRPDQLKEEIERWMR